MAKAKITTAIMLQEQPVADIYDMRIKASEIAEPAVPGQFVSLYSKDGARILPRPISLYGIDKEKGELRLMYRIAGEGTRKFSGLTAGDTIDVPGPLGNGFPLGTGKKAFLIGGGIGIPPMLELAKALHKLNKDEEDNLVQSVLGYKDSQMFLKDEFEAYDPVYAATEDGSFRTSGNVLDAIRKQGLMAGVICACGPIPMLRVLKVYAAEKELECWLSLEEKMACGVGACLACVCRSKEVDSHSQVHNKRICKDGSVFRTDEIEPQACIGERQRGTVQMSMSVNIASVELKNPVMEASGTFGSGMEYNEFVDLNRLGAVVTKDVASMPWPGNLTPRIAEVYGGMLNAIDLQSPGIDVFIKRDIPFLKQYDIKIVVNVCGKTTEEYIDVVERLGDQLVDMLEINISCPSVKEGGTAFGQDPKAVEVITREVRAHARQPIIMKLNPNVTDTTVIARAAEAGGADAISLINTLTGMKIDIHKRTSALTSRVGGLSGPAVKPVAVRMVYQVAQAVEVPIIGTGGIRNVDDVLEFILAGAAAVAIGTTNFHNPYATVETVDGIRACMKTYGIGDTRDPIGAVRQYRQGKAVIKGSDKGQ